VLRLSPDYGADLPLWGMAVEPLQIPPSLLEDLSVWQRTFDRQFDAHWGWISTEAKTSWAEEAVELEARLRSAIEGEVELLVDLWPLEDEGTDRFIRYWFEFGTDRGVGITAVSEDDARQLISEKLFGGAELPPVTRLVPHVDIRAFDLERFRGNMELPEERGVWYPRGHR
jgi:hypothetical protein